MKLKDSKIIFMGTPFFAKEILADLIKNKIKIELVITQSDKLAGRKKIPRPSEVKIFAKENNLPLEQFEKLDKNAFEKIKEINPDIIIVAAYGLIIPSEFLNIPQYGFINIHTSLLPSFRGASPIHEVLIKGLNQTGVTIMKINKGLDSGDIITQKKVSISPEDKYPELENKLIRTSNEILIKTLDSYLNTPQTTSQDHQKATFTSIIRKNQGKIDWKMDAKDIWNNFRAFYLWPQVFTFWKKGKNQKKLILTEINLPKEYEIESLTPGRVFEKDNKVLVETGNGLIEVKKIKMEGKNEMLIKDFLNGNPDLMGSILK